MKRWYRWTSALCGLFLAAASLPGGAAAAQTTQTIEILSAVYGHGDDRTDVTAVLQDRQEADGTLPSFTLTDEGMGVSANEETDRLVVRYRQDGVQKYACTAEGRSFALPYAYDPEQPEETRALLASPLATSTVEKLWPAAGVRGFNFGGLVGNYSANAGNEGMYVTEATFQRLKALGVNCLRIPIAVDAGYAWSADTIPQDDPMAPYRHHLEGLRVALKLAEKYDMWIIPSGDNVVGRKIDVMYNETDGSGYNRTLEQLWSYIAATFGSHPNLLGYDLLNEPNTANDQAYYLNTLVPALVAAIRAVDTNSYVIVESAPYAFPSRFSSLTALEDAKAVYSFHFYWPHQYTHQGLNGSYQTALSYPGTMGNFPSDTPVLWDRAQMEASVQAVVEFQKRTGSTVFVGEFGTVRWAGNAAGWLEDAISVFEQYGWSWCCHSYGGYDGFNPTFTAGSTPSNRMDGGADTDSLQVLRAAFARNATGTVQVRQTGSDAAAVQEFVTEHREENWLAGLVPTVTEEGTAIAVNSGAGWEVLTDGGYATRKSVFPTGRGSGVLRFTFALPQRIEVSELLLVCRENNPGMYGMEYEIYVGDDAATLYTAGNRVFTKTNDADPQGGQLVSYTGDRCPRGRYVGYRLVQATHKYHLGEWGLYGTPTAYRPRVVETDTALATVRGFARSHVNLLAGLTPTVTEEGTAITVNSGTGWEVLTDGEHTTRKSVFPTGRGSGVLRFTFALAQRTVISHMLLVCRENNPGMYGMEYEIYVGDDAATLYAGENRVFVKTDAEHTAGGQLLFCETDICPEGSFVGFRLLDAKNKYHLGDWGVYSVSAEAALTQALGCSALSETANGTAALRFGFRLNCTGVGYEDAGHTAGNYRRHMEQPTLSVGGQRRTLADFGAIVSLTGDTELTVDAADAGDAVRVAAENLYAAEEGAVLYTVRVIQIPPDCLEQTLYARPYVAYSDGTETVILYGQTICGSVRGCRG